MKLKWTLAAAFLAASAAAWGQDPAGWAEIEHATGRDVQVLREGRPVAILEPIGFRLSEGDQVQTGDGTFLEIRLRPEGGRILIAENTVFILTSLSGTRERAFHLVYGRVRAKADRPARGTVFNIRSDSVSAGVRGIDFGYDVLTVPAAGSGAQVPVSRIYAFDGSAVVTVIPAPDAEPEDIRVRAGSMVTVEKVDGRWVPTRMALDEDVLAFWKEREFAARPSGVIDLPTFAKVQDSLRVKNAAILGGVVLVGLGSVLQGVGAYAYSAGDPVLGLNAVAGGAFLGILSVPILVFGLFADPVLAPPR
ncbi:MAG TPA: FecR family protein [Magnetospirillaceae bacterium]|nr:FecR family protein [Magnetospirillaceae bacterium]